MGRNPVILPRVRSLTPLTREQVGALIAWCSSGRCVSQQERQISFLPLETTPFQHIYDPYLLQRPLVGKLC